MKAAEPFTFGIPLIARSATRNWPLVEALLHGEEFLHLTLEES